MRFVLLASLLLALACGDDDGLTIRGAVSVDAEGTPTGFEFLETTRLVDLARGEETDSALAGECILAAGGVTLVVQAPGSAPAGVGLHRFELDLPAEGGGEGAVRAQLGSADYQATVGAECAASLSYRDDDDGAVGAIVDCLLEGPDAASAAVEAELHFGGCVVE